MSFADQQDLIPTGWLREPESRPTFENIAFRLEDMLLDPLRYILTTVCAGRDLGRERCGGEV